jgi:hypothetical protein
LQIANGRRPDAYMTRIINSALKSTKNYRFLLEHSDIPYPDRKASIFSGLMESKELGSTNFDQNPKIDLSGTPSMSFYVDLSYSTCVSMFSRLLF